MLLYDVDPNTVYPAIRSALNRNEIGELRSSHQILPVVMAGNETPIGEHMATGSVLNRQGAPVPVSEICDVRRCVTTRPSWATWRQSMSRLR
jgi:hypothetical protein